MLQIKITTAVIIVGMASWPAISAAAITDETTEALVYASNRVWNCETAYDTNLTTSGQVHIQTKFEFRVTSDMKASGGMAEATGLDSSVYRQGYDLLGFAPEVVDNDFEASNGAVAEIIFDQIKLATRDDLPWGLHWGDLSRYTVYIKPSADHTGEYYIDAISQSSVEDNGFHYCYVD